MQTVSSTRSAAAICAVGLLLHGYEAVFKSAGGFALNLGFFLFSVGPYALAYLLATRFGLPVFALGAALAALLVDLYVHHAVFIAPSGSTAGLGLVIAPLANFLVYGPAGGVGAVLAAKLLFAGTKRA